MTVPSKMNWAARLTVAGAVAALGLAGCADVSQQGGGGGASSNPAGSTVAFLMPDTGSTRYELRDRPGFENKLKELCPDCKPLYNNADGSADKQQQQFNSAIAQGAKAIVLDPVDSAAAVSLVKAAQSQGVKVIAYDRPIPDTKVDFYVSYDNEAIGKEIATSLVEKVKSGGSLPSGAGMLIVNGSPTDAAAGLIKKGIHSAVDTSGVPVLAEYDTIEWKPENAQKWVAGQISRFGAKIVGVVAANDGTAGGAIAAFKSAGGDVPPVSGNDATVAGLQLIIAGDQYNTISKPSEVVGAAAAESAIALLTGKTPESTGDVFGSPTRLFQPTLITQENLKAEIIDKKLNTAAELCTSAYAAACKKLGIQ